MENLNCFTGDIKIDLLDREPFRLNHKIAESPALTMENLTNVILELPQENVMFSKELSNLSTNFEAVLVDGKKNLDLKEVVETLRTSNSYIAVRSPELHPSFHELYKDIVKDVEAFMKANNTGDKAIVPSLWLFIASPGAVTPFHFDRFSNFIMQIRGSKELAVFPPGVEEVISAKDTEAYIDWGNQTPKWRDELDIYAHKFNFKAGEAVHIPFTSGHYVKNGNEDISITLSIFYHTNETLEWTKAMRLNNRMRNFGLAPSPVREFKRKDKLKAKVFPIVEQLQNTINNLMRR